MMRRAAWEGLFSARWRAENSEVVDALLDEAAQGDARRYKREVAGMWAYGASKTVSAVLPVVLAALALCGAVGGAIALTGSFDGADHPWRQLALLAVPLLLTVASMYSLVGHRLGSMWVRTVGIGLLALYLAFAAAAAAGWLSAVDPSPSNEGWARALPWLAAAAVVLGSLLTAFVFSLSLRSSSVSMWITIPVGFVVGVLPAGIGILGLLSPFVPTVFAGCALVACALVARIRTRRAREASSNFSPAPPTPVS